MIDCKCIPNVYLGHLEHYRSFKNDKVLFDLDCGLKVKNDVTNGLFTYGFLLVVNTYIMANMTGYNARTQF